ncbi:uncharacterized protein BDR25DRAFT_285703 [Lindgomyces ingoldianus]|uniref:Uncharacterized protein n=1 Tax=Lindgomyces ingoldianus TaxID=673940 RepID=A0ACB6QY95_9PLEO|nr:uncharacterized protein BDR25DRAFT_285703 [Lindgomyces ingoldianus]KAF2471252.1 hypothetical protein BDR25DRAFT_285703 [Lindgomyces ingoldianus]
MAAARLPFLWPIFYRPLNSPQTASRIVRRDVRLSKDVTTAARRAQSRVVQRYGTAQEPAPHFREAEISEEKKEKPAELDSKSPRANAVEEEEEEGVLPPSSPSPPKTLGGSESVSQSTSDPLRMPESKHLDTVLHMPSPAEEEKQKPPHLKPPPYVHHFDTYSLVKDLAKSGFNKEQAVTVMKAVRGILTDNMELARASLVSKSNVENETYLFRAACSELRTEISNNRKGETEKMRTERNRLQHEVDILNQRLMQETTALKDELKGLFDDRKMAVRQEQRTMETKIQELNYKITVALNSDARSEVEGLRWVLTRRAAIAIGVSALMLFAVLRYSSYVTHAQSEERKKARETKPSPDQRMLNPGNPNSEPLGGELLASEGGASLG